MLHITTYGICVITIIHSKSVNKPSELGSFVTIVTKAMFCKRLIYHFLKINSRGTNRDFQKYRGHDFSWLLSAAAD